jgi:general nucleoside transport system permease protein
MIGVFDIALLASTVRLFTPILLAALGGMFTSRAGIFNFALEGMMLVGSFFGMAGVFWTGNAYAGLALAVLSATAVALIFGFFVIDVQGDPVIIGLAVNILSLGLTTYAMRLVFGVAGGGYYDPKLKGLPNLALPIINDLPVVGTVLSGHSILVYASWLFVILAYLLLFQHPIGLHLRAVGENAVAAGSLGVNVRGVRYLSVTLCGALCGLAGAQLSLSLVTQFVEGMTAGRGFIALVAIMFGQAHPIKIFGSSLLFGFAYAASLRLQGVGIPTQFVSMLPYVATIAVLLIARIQTRPPQKLKGELLDDVAVT